MIVDIEFRGITLEVHGTYIPKEVQVTIRDGAEDYSGAVDSFTLEKVFIESTEVHDLLEEHTEEIEELVLIQLNKEE